MAVFSRLSLALGRAGLRAAPAASRITPFQTAVRTFSSAAQTTPAAPRKLVGFWLFGCCGLVFTTVVVGGITRLTESGLSIVRWQPLEGIVKPSTEEEWAAEFERYKQFPEFKYNKNMTLEDFKYIFHWEWGHRVLGRLVGAAFAIPAAIFWRAGWLLPGHKKNILMLGSLIGFQGALGWYMVKSGLDNDPHGAHSPRVSHYRLMAHLGSAFTLHLGMLWTGLQYFPAAARSVPSYGMLPVLTAGVAGLTFFTAMSGALVAGLDAGLIYNSYPKMGDYWVPPEILSMEPTYRNFFDNLTTVQFDHRILAVTTLAAINSLFLFARKAPLHRRARIALTALTHMSWVQVALGISTLLLFVPVHLGATHQAGALTLMTLATWAVHELKRLPK
eukprot:m.236120 g.236120  ORF g.236120 m.236120 type:complete len:389 (-) comp12930_c0_seq1:86-1252(-)